MKYNKRSAGEKKQKTIQRGCTVAAFSERLTGTLKVSKDQTFAAISPSPTAADSLHQPRQTKPAETSRLYVYIRAGP